MAFHAFRYNPPYRPDRTLSPILPVGFYLRPRNYG